MYLLMSSGHLFWSGRETGNTGVALTEMASPGPWEEGHSPEPFFHKSTWRQVSREWQKVQVMRLTHSVAAGCICVMWFSAENRKSGTQWTAIPNPFPENGNTSLFLVLSPQQTPQCTSFVSQVLVTALPEPIWSPASFVVLEKGI